MFRSPSTLTCLKIRTLPQGATTRIVVCKPLEFEVLDHPSGIFTSEDFYVLSGKLWSGSWLVGGHDGHVVLFPNALLDLLINTRLR